MKSRSLKDIFSLGLNEFLALLFDIPYLNCQFYVIQEICAWFLFEVEELANSFLFNSIFTVQLILKMGTNQFNQFILNLAKQPRYLTLQFYCYAFFCGHLDIEFVKKINSCYLASALLAKMPSLPTKISAKLLGMDINQQFIIECVMDFFPPISIDMASMEIYEILLMMSKCN